MLYQKIKILFLLLFILAFSVFTQTWKDDSLVVRQILDTNGLDTVPVENVVGGKDSTGRIKSLYFWQMPSFNLVPASIGNLNKLMDLKIGYTNISSLPTTFGNLKLLTIVDLVYNKLTSLPSEIGNLVSLVTLYICNNEITSLPPEIGKCKKIYFLQIQNNKITKLPDEICNIDSLGDINAMNNLINYIPEKIGNMPVFHSILLGNNKLKHAPNSLIPFGFDDVYLCGNDSLVFTPEQKTAWDVKDYKDFEIKHCVVNISDENIPKKQSTHVQIQINNKSVVLHLSRNSQVCCAVYDLSGRFFQTLINKDLVAGTHTITWNRVHYSPGVYVLRYTAGKGDSFSKAVVVK